MLNTIADVLGIASFAVSVLTFVFTHTILKNVKFQRNEFEHERIELQTSLMALRDNIWKDKQPLSLKYRSSIRTLLYTYRQKYLHISSIICLFHLSKAIKICDKTNPDQNDREKLCKSIDFLIARFNKTEVANNDQ